MAKKKERLATHIGMVCCNRWDESDAKPKRLFETPKMYVTEDGDWRFPKEPRYNGKWSMGRRTNSGYGNKPGLDIDSVRPATDADHLEYYTVLAEKAERIVVNCARIVEKVEADLRRHRDRFRRLEAEVEAARARAHSFKETAK